MAGRGAGEGLIEHGTLARRLLRAGATAPTRQNSASKLPSTRLHTERLTDIPLPARCQLIGNDDALAARRGQSRARGPGAEQQTALPPR